MEEPSLCDLHFASMSGNLSRVKSLLSQGRTDVNCKEWIDRTPVMWAAGEGHVEVVRILVSKGASLSLTDRFGLNILHFACLGGDVEVVKYVLSQNVLHINSRVSCKRTGVMLAAENGHRDVVELLVGKGAKMSLVDRRGENILHCACRGGHVEVVKYILAQNKVNINSRGWKKKTPVMMAGEWGYKEVVKVLVQNGVDLSLRDKRGDNVLHLACRKGHVEVVEYVLSLDKIDINCKGYYADTPVMAAGENGHEEIVELLVTNGAKLSPRNRGGDTILHTASWDGHTEVLKYVLSLHRMDIDSRGWKNRSPLLSAGQQGQKEVVELLVQNGADVLLTDFAGDNILHYVCFSGYVEILKYVLSLHRVDVNKRGWKKRTPLLSAGIKGHKEVVELLVQNGADLSKGDDGGDNILHYVCREGYVEVVKYVISLHRVDVNSKGWKKRTPLMSAGMKGQKAVVELLVQNGADLSCSDNDGDNILHHACREGHMEVVKYVISLHRVDVNSKGWKKRTPLLSAGMKGQKAVVELLVQNGADLSYSDDDGNNILHHACREGHMEVVKYVLSQGIVDINALNKKGETAAKIATSKGRGQVVDLLVSNDDNK